MSTIMRATAPRDSDRRAVHADESVPILVVDNNPTKRLALTAVLSPLGYDVVEAESGIAALRSVLTRDFAVILLDVRMPIMNGIETAALIRRRRQSETTPIIFVTAHGTHEFERTEGYAEGAVDYIFAPVEPDELRAKVSVFANLFSKAETLAARAREVKTSADQLRLLTDAAPIGIFQTDSAGRYVYTNPRWAEITGVASDDAVGQMWNIVVDPEQRTDFLSRLADGEVDRGELSYRFEIRVPGSEPRIVQATARSIPDTNGGGAGWVGTLADVTAETWAEAAMSDARDKATEASRLKSDFLANMSHEIRTPMNGVIGMTDLLLETDLDSRQRDYAQTVRNSGEALLTIINDILDFSKIEAGMLEMERIEFNVEAIVNEVVDLLTGPAKAKDLELRSVIDGSIPDVVIGDPGRVRQILTNLIANAVKFTQAGEVVVRVTEVDVAGSDTVIRFEVSDTGDGIEPDKLDMIFQPFVQADTSTSRKYGGTGLGLAISVQLVALMGGDCGVSSHLREGSIFWFTIRVPADLGRGNGASSPHSGVEGVALPETEMAEATEVAVVVPTATPEARPVQGRSVRLLLAEDNQINQKVAVAILSNAGYTVDTVLNGEAAVMAVASQPYDAILMDCQMPVMNGYEATAAIRARGGPAGLTPIIAMTAGARLEDQERCLAEGMDSYLSKPVSKDALLALVSRSVRKGRR